jgi:maltodextrin utilization protein YvdJ
MFIAILTLLSALSISGVAIFYSVIGLATIFPGAFVPVVIMGGVLEVGKLITASWLYRNWKFTPFMLKTYLTTAVIILSLITSMGIFGFLSKAHLEQNLASDTLIQRIQILEDKIESEKMSIERQTMIINRAEKAISRDTGTASGDIEVQQSIIADANEKLKTLLAVETNTVRDLNDRLKVLDKNVSDVLTSNKSFFNEEKAAADLKASQKAEREQIAVKVKEAQDRIAELKRDHKQEIAKAQEIIANMRTGSQDNKGQFTKEIENAEKKIFDSQGNIDLYIVEKQPLEKEMLTLEAEIGPVKYIAALAVDWGITDQVETSKAVRWVILLLIVVFDPLAVLLLIAANQSLMRRFPPEAPKPQEIVDLEKPDDEGIDLKWNAMMDKSNAVERMEAATEQLQEWKDKLESFNSKVEKPEDKPVEIIQEEDDVIPHIDLKGQKKTEDKEIVVDNTTDGFDPDEVMFEMEANPPVDKEKQLEEFKKREAEEQKALEEFARKAREDDEEQTISEQIEEAMEPERTKPDFTEVIEPEIAVEQPKDKDTVGTLGTVLVKDKKVVQPPKPQKPELPNPAEMTDFERTGMLNKFYQEHGKYEDISDEDLKMERDQSNKAQFLADVSLTKEEAAEQGPITESRMAFFQDIIDDILRGDQTFENVPEENRKIIAQIMDPDIDNPQIITKGSALKAEGVDGVEKTTAEGLKEKFMIQPDIEDRPMTDEELDQLLEGFDSGEKTVSGKRKMIIKNGQRIFVPVEEKKEYVQNEEQSDQTLWQKTKELDIPEPEKNEVILPDLPNTADDIPDIAESIAVEQSIPQAKFDTYKKRLTSEEDYHQRVEARINDLITKLDSKEIKLSDLSKEDQQVIIDILNQNDGSI